MKKQTFFAALLLVGCLIAGVALLVTLDHADTSISFSETPHEVTLLASFPDEDSKMVQAYIKQQFKMNDVSDFSDLEIKEYDVPDQKMQLSIKSSDGHLKIVLDKDNNSLSSRRQLKHTCDGLNKLLTRR